MIEDAQVGFYSAYLAAEAQAIPAWNKGDEFEATRLKALRDAGAAAGTH